MRWLCSFAVALAACSTPRPPGSDAGPIDPTWTSIYGTVISNNCAVELCHIGTDSPAGMLDMETSDLAYANLVDVEAMGEKCAGLAVRVVSGDPDNSLLSHKLEGSVFPDGTPLCGARMPYRADPLPPQWIVQIRIWIEMGAPKN